MKEYISFLSYCLKMRTIDKYTHNSLEKVEIKDYNVMIDRKNFFDQPVKSDMKTYDNIWKIATG